MIDLSSFLNTNIFGCDSFQNMSVYQPTLNTLQVLKEDKDVLLVGNQNEYMLLNLPHPVLYSCITKLSLYKIGMLFNKSVLVVTMSAI